MAEEKEVSRCACNAAFNPEFFDRAVHPSMSHSGHETFLLLIILAELVAIVARRLDIYSAWTDTWRLSDNFDHGHLSLQVKHHFLLFAISGQVKAPVLVDSPCFSRSRKQLACAENEVLSLK